MASVKRLMFSLFACALSVIAVRAEESYYPKGRLVEPPPRLSLWRHGYDTPKYTEDNELSCYVRKGKRKVPNISDPSKCGLCGETSVVAKSLQIEDLRIVRTYQQGDNIKAGVVLVTPTVRRGWFQFQLCRKCTPNEQETDICFEKHILNVLSLSRIDPNKPLEARLAAVSENNPHQEGSSSLATAAADDVDIMSEIPQHGEGEGLYSIPADLPPDTVLLIELQLPPDVSCDTCVLRWKYFAGKHQRLYGCADVRISASGNWAQNLDPDCLPIDELPREDQVVIVHRRDQIRSNMTSAFLVEATDGTRAHADSLPLQMNGQNGAMKELRTIENLNDPGILLQISSSYPDVDGQKVQVTKNPNLSKSAAAKQMQRSAPEDKASMSTGTASRLPLSCFVPFFFFFFLHSLFLPFFD